MSKLPQIAGLEVIKVMTRVFGYRVRDHRGSHITLVHEWRPALTVPLQAELAKGTLLAILRQARIGREEFLDALDS